jgi:hypothetical protein
MIVFILPVGTEVDHLHGLCHLWGLLGVHVGGGAPATAPAPRLFASAYRSRTSNRLFGHRRALDLRIDHRGDSRLQLPEALGASRR